MKKLLITAAIVVIAFNATAQFNMLVWADEFNYAGLPDSTKWNYDTGNHGWGNNELQFYTRKRMENAWVANGVLTIKAVKEKYHGADYTSARLLTKGKAAWRYGRIEVRAKLPYGRGIWPAIWMLSADKAYGEWPRIGEIDIMEHVGYSPDSVFATVHTQAYNHTIGTQKTRGVAYKDLSASFHVYALEWTKNKISIFIDNNKYFEFDNEGKGVAVWPFDKKFYLLLNVAVGGNWGGKMGIDNNIFPQEMQIDYVRVYQKK